MNKNELYKLLAEEEKRGEKWARKKELKRLAIIFIGYTVALSYVFVNLEAARGFSEIADSVLLAILTSAVLLIANTIIFNWFFERRKEDKEKLEYIKENIQKSIDKLEKLEQNEKNNN